MTDVILKQDPRAASFRTVTGWVSRDGYFYGRNEDAARERGATHRLCEDCEGVIENKAYLCCQPCLAKRARARYEALPRKHWDGETMVYSHVLNEYFSSPDEAIDAAFLDQPDDAPLPTVDSLQMVLCEPLHARELEISDFEAVLPTDYDEDKVPEWLIASIAEFNESIKRRPPLSYTYGKYAIDSDPNMTP